MGFLIDWTEDILKSSIERVFGVKIEEIKLNFICKKIQKELHERILIKYQDEPFYNSLDKFLSTKNIFSKLCDLCCDCFNTKNEGSTVFSKQNVDLFLNENPDFQRYKLYLESCFNDIYTIAFSVINMLSTEMKGVVNTVIEKQNENTNKIITEYKKDVEILYNRISAKIDGIGIQIAPIYSTESIQIDKHLDVSPYYKRVTEIEEKYQSKFDFEQAIEQYQELIDDILNQNNTSIDNELLVTIYVNKALSYMNLNQDVKAKKQLDYALNKMDIKKKQYYYVSAMLFAQSKFRNFEESLSMLNEALNIDLDYNKAILLRYYILALLKKDSYENILSEAQKQFQSVLNDNTDLHLISSYYQSIGLVSKVFCRYIDAIFFFKKADELEINIVNKVNAALTYYSWALEGNDSTKYVLKPKINYYQLNTCINLCKEIIKMDHPFKQSYIHLVLEIYISACAFSNNYSDIVTLPKQYLGDINDYNTKRNILFSKLKEGVLTDEEADSFIAEDKLLYEATLKEEKGDIEGAIELIYSNLNRCNQDRLSIMYNYLLVSSIHNKDIERYKQFRSEVIANNIEIPDIDLYDALYYEIAGDTTESKKRFDKISLNSVSYLTTLSCIDFYERHNFEVEAIGTIKELHNKVINSEIILNNNEFYKKSFRYIIPRDYEVSYEMYCQISPEILDETLYYEIEADILFRTKGNANLCKTFDNLFRLNKNPSELYNSAVSYFLTFQTKEAKKRTFELLGIDTITQDEKTNANILLSRIYLLEKDNEKCIEYAKLAHELNVKIPSNESHQFYFSMATRTNKMDEDFSEIVRYKNYHPNAVDWMIAIKGIEKDKNGNDVLSKEFLDIINIEQYEKEKELFRNAYNDLNISLYQMTTFFRSDYSQIIDKVYDNKLKFKIASGHKDDMWSEIKSLNKNAVVDTLTLLLLAQMDLLELLSEFETVYITSQTASEVINSCMISFHPASIVVYDYIAKQLNIKILPCSIELKAPEEINYYPVNIIDSLKIAKKQNATFIYADFRIKKSCGINDVLYISICSLLRLRAISDIDLSCLGTYKLLKDNWYTFISFNPQDIFYIIKSNNFAVTDDLLAPFFICKSYYDVESFTQVYYLTLKLLFYNTTDIVAKKYICCVFKHLDKIYHKIDHYNYCFETFESTVDKISATIIEEYVRSTFIEFFKEMVQNDISIRDVLELIYFKHIPSELIKNCLDQYKANQ